MFQRIGVDVVDMPGIVQLCFNCMLPVPPLPQIRLEWIWMRNTRKATAMEGGCQMPHSKRLWRIVDNRSSVRGNPFEKNNNHPPKSYVECWHKDTSIMINNQRK